MRNHLLFLLHFLQLAESAKAQFAARNYSDHLALVRAFEGWKDAERRQASYEYCWRNFLSAQTLRAIDSLRKQFFFLLQDTGLVDHNPENCNRLSHDEHLIRAVICAGLFPGICSVVVSHAPWLPHPPSFSLFSFFFLAASPYIFFSSLHVWFYLSCKLKSSEQKDL